MLTPTENYHMSTLPPLENRSTYDSTRSSTQDMAMNQTFGDPLLLTYSTTASGICGGVGIWFDH